MRTLPTRWARRVAGAFLTTITFFYVAFYGLPLTFESSNVPAVWLGQYPLTPNPHPVEVLHRKAYTHFNHLINQQSRTAEEAIAEYVKRYRRNPPPGFREWAEYALAHQSPIIDDFDMIVENLNPFLNLTTDEFMARMRKATQGQNPRVDRCSFSEGKFSTGCRKFSKAMATVLGDAAQSLPDLAIVMNFLDEPAILTAKDEYNGDPYQWVDKGHSPLGAEIHRSCNRRGNLETKKIDKVETHGLPFVQNVNAEKDLCLHRDYQRKHGFLMSPTSMRCIHAEVPILSRAAPYPFSDIIYPSPHYAFRDNQYNSWWDKSWKRKKNALYWAGSTTGGYWKDRSTTWRKGHRQRFASLGMHKEEDKEFTYLDDSHGLYEPYTSQDFNTSLYDVRVTMIHQCEPDNCALQKEFFGVRGRMPYDSKAYSYRFLFDIDGNGYSGRFYKFLASHSVPLKTTIFREWHDERLIPWWHYIPVSQGMDELPELMRFLATTPQGQSISQRIAEAGRDWYYKAMTEVHQGIYLYRLLLELAWLQDESRSVELDLRA